MKEPSYEIIRPDNFEVTEANQKLLDQGFGKWGKPVNAQTWLANGGTLEQMVYLFCYQPIVYVGIAGMVTLQK